MYCPSVFDQREWNKLKGRLWSSFGPLSGLTRQNFDEFLEKIGFEIDMPHHEYSYEYNLMSIARKYGIADLLAIRIFDAIEAAGKLYAKISLIGGILLTLALYPFYLILTRNYGIPSSSVFIISGIAFLVFMVHIYRGVDSLSSLSTFHKRR